MKNLNENTLRIIAYTLLAINVVLVLITGNRLVGAMGWGLAMFNFYTSSYWFKTLMKARQEHIDFLDDLLRSQGVTPPEDKTNK